MRGDILKNIGVVGIGRVGQAVAKTLSKEGYSIIGINDIQEELANDFAKEIGSKVVTLKKLTRDSEIIFITTPDRYIKKVAKEIALFSLKNKFVIHMSGLLDSLELIDCRKKGAIIMSLHPLQAFASIQEALVNLPGSYFAFEGDKSAAGIARELVQRWQGKLITIRRELKPLYHAAACIASNYLVTLLEDAIHLLEESGFDRKLALEAVLPLVRGTINNISAKGTKDALTGPIVRGDYLTVEKHIKEISKTNNDLLMTYRVMGLRTVQHLRDTSMLNDEILDKINQTLLLNISSEGENIYGDKKYYN